MLKKLLLSSLLSVYSLFGATYDIIGTGQDLNVAYGDVYNISGTFGNVTNYGTINTSDSSPLHITGNYLQPFLNTNSNVSYFVGGAANITVDGSVSIDGNTDNRAYFAIHSSSIMTIHGNYTMNTIHVGSITGVLDVKGNYTVTHLAEHGMNGGELRLSGTGIQQVSGTHFDPLDDLNITNTTGNVSLIDDILHFNGIATITAPETMEFNNLSLLMLNNAGYQMTFTNPLTVNGYLKILAGDLNVPLGMTINGDLYNYDAINPSDTGVIHVTGNYIQDSTDTLIMTELIVGSAGIQIDGNVTLNGRSSDNLTYWSIPSGNQMTVGGDVTVNANDIAQIMGTLEIKGNYTVASTGNEDFNGGLLLLSGTDRQEVSLNSTSSDIWNLTITNHSVSGVTFNDSFTIYHDLNYESCSNLNNLDLLIINGTTTQIGCTGMNITPILYLLVN